MAFGYPGDATGDSASLAGTGAFSFDDPERGGTPMVPLQDAALKTEDAQDIYHVAPGETFVNPADGKTYRYADKIPDWSPAKPGYVDVYDPSHPPDDTVSRKLQRPPGKAPETEALKESPEPPAEAPEPDTETPVDKIKKAFPESAKWTPQQFETKLQRWFPDVPPDRIKVYAVQPGGTELIQQYRTRDKSPLEKFRILYPQFATGDTDKDVQWMHDHLEPNTPLDKFRERVVPPNPVMTAISHILRGLSVENNRFFSSLSTPTPPSINAGLAGSIAGFEEFPKATTDWLANLYKLSGDYGWTKAASEWMTKNVPKYGKANKWFQGFVNHLAGRAREWEKSSAAYKTQEPANHPIANIIGEALGSTPEMAVSFGMGSGEAETLSGAASLLRNSALFGTLYESVSAYGHAIEHQQKNAAIQGIAAGGFRVLFQYVINTAKGRMVSGVLNAISNVSDDQIQKFARGEPNSIDKEGTAFVSGAIIGLLNSGAGEGSASIERDYVGMGDRARLTTKGLEWSFDNHPAPVREELEKAAQAHEEGDYDKAAQHLDKSLVFMPDDKKRDTAVQVINKIDELSGEKPKELDDYFLSGPWKPGRHNKFAKEETIESVAIRYNGKIYTGVTHPLAMEKAASEKPFTGKNPHSYDPLLASLKEDPWHLVSNYSESGFLTSKGRFVDREEAKRIKGLSGSASHVDIEGYSREKANQLAEKESYAIGKLREVNPDAADRYAKMSPKEQAVALNELHHYNPQWNPASDFFEGKKSGDTFNDYYFGGIPFPAKAIKDWFDEKTEDVRKIPSYVRPYFGSDTRETAAQIMRIEVGKSKQSLTTVPAAIARKHKVPEAFRKIEGIMHGDRAEVQRRYINTRTSQQQVQDMIDYQNGTPIKDKLTHYLYENFHRPWMTSILDREHRYGIETPAMLNYIMHKWVRPEEFPKLEAALKQRAINPSFIKEQQMDLATGTALGWRLKNTNIVDIDRFRMLLSDFAVREIRVLRELEKEGYAWEANRKDIPQQYRKPELKLDTADGKSYVIDPDLVPLWNNAFDKNSVFNANPVSKVFFGLANKAKGMAAYTVSFSAYHPIHIMGITSADVASNALWRMRHGEINWKNAWDAAIGITPAGSIYHTTAASRRYRGPVSFLQGRIEFKDLDPGDQRAVQDFQDMGLTVEVNHERGLQFMDFFQKTFPKWEKADKTGMVRMGGQVLDIVGNGFNRWWFGTITPNLKFASAMMRRDTLAMTRPDLFRDVNRQELLREYGKIHRNIEGRYGEMNYEALFQPRMLKQIGTASLLSYGWQLGMIRVLGDGVIDTTSNLAHWHQLVEEAKARGATGVADKLLNERLAYLAIYGAHMLITGWAISSLIYGKRPDQLTLWDGMYPYAGKDSTGRDKRLGMQYFFKEIPSYWHYSQMANDDIAGFSPTAALKLGQGKLNPMWNAVGQALTNQDFADHAIGTFPQRIEHLLVQGMAPFSFENMGVPGATAGDRAMSILGFSPSGRWTMHSDMENKVLSQYLAGKHGPVMQARDEYRKAFIAKDQGAMKQAREKLLSLHVPEKSIRNIEKTANISSAMKVFNQLQKQQQIDDLKELSPQDRQEWLKHASPDVRLRVK